jgi:hypothetical protein
MTLDYNKMFLAVTLEAVIKGHFIFVFPSPMGSFFMRKSTPFPGSAFAATGNGALCVCISLWLSGRRILFL